MPHDVEQLLMSGLFYIDEVPFREMIHDGIQEGMPVGFTASECKEADLLSCEINMGPDQAVRPRTIDHKGVTEQAYPTVGISSAQVNNAAHKPSLEIELPRASGGTGVCGAQPRYAIEHVDGRQWRTWPTETARPQ